MAQMIQHGSELLRINTQKNDIEYSKDGGRTQHHRQLLILFIMTYFQLTETMTRTSFEETGIDEKYYPIYAKIAKRFFEDLSKEGSNEDGKT